MKKVLLFPPFFAFLSLFTLFSYADDAGTSGGLDVGQTILYVVLVLAFCAGLLIISKWSAKIRQRDEQLAMERAKFEEEQRQNGSSEASAEGEDEAEEEEEEENGWGGLRKFLPAGGFLKIKNQTKKSVVLSTGFFIFLCYT